MVSARLYEISIVYFIQGEITKSESMGSSLTFDISSVNCKACPEGVHNFV